MGLKKVIGILLILIVLILSFYMITKMSYSVGYEDGKDGIVTMIGMQGPGNSITKIIDNPNSETTRKIVYFILNKFRTT